MTLGSDLAAFYAEHRSCL